MSFPSIVSVGWPHARMNFHEKNAVLVQKVGVESGQFWDLLLEGCRIKIMQMLHTKNESKVEDDSKCSLRARWRERS